MSSHARDWSRLQNVLILLLVLAFSLYLPTLFHYAFADDEIYLAYTNRFLRESEWYELYQLLLKPANPWEFLPLRDFTYWLDFRLYGDETGGFHASNLLWYLASWAASFWMFRELIQFCRPAWESRATVLALCGIAIFAVHPAHVEVVAWIASRKDLLAGTFSFLSIAMLARAFRHEWSGGGMWAAAALLAMACFSKASAVACIIPVTVLFGAAWNCSYGVSRRRRIGYLLIFFAVTGLSVSVHMNVSEVSGIRIENHLDAFTMLDRASRIFTALIGIMLFPYPSRFYYDVYQLGTWHWLVSAASVILLAAAFIVFLQRRSLWAVGVLLALSPLVVYLQFLPFTTWSLASERFVFVSIAGMSILLIDLLGRIANPNRIMVLLIVVAMPSAAIVWSRVAQWEDSHRLLAREYELQPYFHNAVRDRIVYVLLPGERYVEAEVLARQLPRSYAENALLALIETERVYQRMTKARYAQKQDFDESVFRADFCSAVSALRSTVDLGYSQMRSEYDISYNNILRTLEQWLKLQYGDSKRLCRDEPR